MREFPSNVVLLGEHLEYESFENILLTTLLHPEDWIYLYCAGDGGPTDLAFSVIDVCRAHGKVVGILTGAATSSNAAVWAGMPHRYTYPMGRMDIHMGGASNVDTRIDSQMLYRMWIDFESTDRRLARIYSEMGKYNEDWWYHKHVEAGSGHIISYPAEWLIEEGLCKPASELKLELLFSDPE